MWRGNIKHLKVDKKDSVENLFLTNPVSKNLVTIANV